MNTISGALAKKIIQRAGLGHAHNIKRHIDIAAEHNVISHDDARQLKKEYEKLYLGKPLQKQKVKDLLNRLKDRKIKIPGTHLHTLESNPEKTIARATRAVHAEERAAHEKIIEENNAQSPKLQSSEDEQDEKKKKEREAAATLLHAPIALPGQRIMQQHAGQTPIGKTLGAKKAA